MFLFFWNKAYSVNTKNVKLYYTYTNHFYYICVNYKGHMYIQTYVKHSINLKFNQINNRMWNKSKIQNVQYKLLEVLYMQH